MRKWRSKRKRIEQSRSNKENGSFLSAKINIDGVDDSEIIQQAGDLQKSAAVFERGPSGNVLCRLDRDQETYQVAKAVSEGCENIQEIKQCSILEIETRVIGSAAPESDDEHRPYRDR